jgi:hypothetical protein
MTNDTNHAPRRKDDVHPDRELTWTEPAPVDAQLTDVMIDTETAGTTPGSAILSIGAVMFGPAGLGKEFYAPISLASCTAAGLTIDPGTIAWWMKQSDAARAAAFRDDAEPLLVVLLRFAEWITTVGAERPWCQGANFDTPLLEAAYSICGMTPPWKFWNVRDTRTLYELADVRVDRAHGTHHNALDDARAQAEAAVVALQRLRDVRTTIADPLARAPLPAQATGTAKRLRDLAAGKIAGEIPAFEYSLAADRIQDLEGLLEQAKDAAPAHAGDARDYFAWWTSIETDVRKSMLVFAHREPDRLHALVKQAYDEGQQSVRAAMSASQGKTQEVK